MNNSYSSNYVVENLESTAEPALVSKRAIFFNLALLVVIFGALLIYLLTSSDQTYLSISFTSFRWRWLWVGIGLLFVYLACEVGTLYVSTRMAQGNLKLSHLITISAVGQFYGIITPMATGAQPAQLLYFNRFGLPLARSAFALISKFVIFQIVLSIYALVFLFARFGYFTSVYGSITLIAVPALGLHFLIVIALVTVTISERVSRSIALFFLKIYGFIRPKHNLQPLRNKVLAQIHEYSQSTHELPKHYGSLSLMTLLTAIQLLAYYLIPACLILSLRLPINDLLTAVAAAAFVIMLQTAMPLPGGSGAAEGGFAAFFSLLFPSSTSIMLALLAWRFITLVLPVLISIPFLFIADGLAARHRQIQE